MKPLQKTGKEKIHFILGSGRSGTTLLLHILNNHKNCVSSPECKHLLLFYDKYHAMTEITPALLKDAWDYFHLKIDAESIKDHGEYSTALSGLKAGDKMNYFELCKQLYLVAANYKHDKELKIIVDKNPTYTLQVDKLHALLPDAKFLCLVRDYRGFCLSNMQGPENYAKNLPVQYHALVWRFYNKLVLDIKRNLGDKAAVFYYEKLVSNKEQTFREVCGFFEVEYDAGAFEYQQKVNLKKEEDLKDRRMAYKRDSLSKPVNTSRLEAWKTYFSKFQLKSIDFWCGKTGVQLGYERDTKAGVLEALIILLISLPYYLRVFIYFKLKSVKLNVYLSEGRQARHIRSLYKK